LWYVTTSTAGDGLTVSVAALLVKLPVASVTATVNFFAAIQDRRCGCRITEEVAAAMAAPFFCH